MPRQSERQVRMAVESLESRNLQSGVAANADYGLLLPAVRPSAVISPTSPDLKQGPGFHGYERISGFFGQ
jgi:hypothetical protein